MNFDNSDPIVEVEATCPACEQPFQHGDEICPYCGIVYARYKPRSERVLAQQKNAASKKLSGKAKGKAFSEKGVRGKGRKVYLSARQLEALLLSTAEALEAGLTFHSFANGAMMGALPQSLTVQLKRFSSDGVSVVDALDAVRVLDASAIALLRVGETQGKLTPALRVVSARVAQKRENRNQLLRKLFYPAALLLVHFLVSPLSLLIFKGVGAYLHAISRPILGMSGVAFFLFVVFPRLDPDHPLFRAIRTVGAFVPPFHHIRKHNAIATLTGTLGACVSAGLPLRPSLRMACEATQHPLFQNAAKGLLEAIQSGSSLSEALASLRMMPKEVIAQIGHGEQVGALDHVLERIAKKHREHHRLAMNSTIVFLGIFATVAIFAYLILAIVGQWKAQVGTLQNQLNGALQQLLR